MGKTVGVLAFHGDVIEHLEITKKAARNLKLNIKVIPVRTKKEIDKVEALIIPGGESTTLYKLCWQEGMWSKMKQIKNIFGTCAGAIMLAKKVAHKEAGQKTLALMDLTVNRNAYGRQSESFEKKIASKLGTIEAVFIRAPRIKGVGAGVKVLAKDRGEIIACEQRVGKKFYLAACFHPELTTTKFHEYFLGQVFQ